MDLKVEATRSLLDKRKIVAMASRTVKERQAKFANLLVHDLSTSSPRLTGRFQASWMATLDRPAKIGDVPERTRIPDSIQPSMSRQLAGIRNYGRSPGKIRTVVVSNPLHYWFYLEYFHEKAGFIAKAMNKARMAAGLIFKGKGDLAYGPGGRKAVMRVTK